MYTKLSASRSYVYAVARACDAGKVSRQVSDGLTRCQVVLTQTRRIALVRYCTLRIELWS